MATTRKTGEPQRKRAQGTLALKRRGAITCKSPYRHDWDLVGPVPERRRPRKSFGTLVTFRCTHCGSFRFWVLSRLTGDLLSAWYVHSDDYRQLLDLGMSVKEWRAAWLDELDNELLESLEDLEPPTPIKRRRKTA